MHKAGCSHLQTAQLTTVSHKIAMLTLTHVAHIILESRTYAGRGTGARHRRSLDSIGPAPPGELRAIAAWPDRRVVQIWLAGSLDRGSICLQKPFVHLCRSSLLWSVWDLPTSFPEHQESLSAGPTTRQAQAAADARMEPLPGATAEAHTGLCRHWLTGRRDLGTGEHHCQGFAQCMTMGMPGLMTLSSMLCLTRIQHCAECIEGAELRLLCLHEPLCWHV